MRHKYYNYLVYNNYVDSVAAMLIAIKGQLLLILLYKYEP